MNSDMGPGFYEKNLVTLKNTFPGIFSRVAKCNIETPENVVVEGADGFVDVITTFSGGSRKALYGDVNPVTEAHEIFREVNLRSCDTLFMMGMGLGYHALASIDQFSEKPFLVIFEPSLKLFAIALRNLDLSQLLAYPYLDIYIGQDFDIRREVEKYKPSLSFGEAQLLSCFPPSPFYSDLYKSGHVFLQEWLKSQQNHRVTLEDSSRKIFQNTIENLPSLFAGQSLKKLESALQGIPAFCVAAGPSLNSSFDELKKIGNRALVIAFDSAVQALVEAGIRPHIVVTADLKDLNFEKLRNVLGDVREAVLIFALGANSGNVGAFLSPRRIGVASENDLLCKWLCRHLNIDSQVPAMTSVGQTALFTSAVLGLNPIVLVGMDLAFPEGLDHADNTVFRSFPHPDSVLLVEGVGGRPVSSQAALIADKVQIERVIAGVENRIINTSMGGLLLAGTEVRSLEEVVGGELNSQVDVVDLLNGVDWQSPIAISNIVCVYRKMLSDLAEFSRDCETGQEMVALFLAAVSSPEIPEGGPQVNEITNFYEKLKQNWSDIGNILSGARFKGLQDIKRRQIKLDKNRVSMTEAEVSAEEAGIVGDDLASLQDAVDYFSKLLREQLSYYQKLESSLASEDVAGEEKLLAAAGVNLEGKQFWLAEKDFRSIEPGSKQYFTALCGMASSYCRLGLWIELQKHLILMERCCPEAEEILFYRENLKERVASLTADIKKLWQEGHKEQARRSIMEYMKLQPDDYEIAEICDKIIACDEETAESVKKDYSVKEGKVLSEEQLLVKAQRFLQAGEAEPAIGILEGLSRRNKEKSIFYREKIGDIRLHGKDLRSALCHYRQAFADDVVARKLQEKITQLKSG